MSFQQFETTLSDGFVPILAAEPPIAPELLEVQRRTAHQTTLAAVSHGLYTLRRIALENYPTTDPEAPLEGVVTSWEKQAGYFGELSAGRWIGVRNDRLAAARDASPHNLDMADRYLLAMSNDQLPPDFPGPPEGYHTPWGYYAQTGARLEDALKDGVLLAECESVLTLERMTHLLLAQGFIDFGLNIEQPSQVLETATAILSYAAQIAPGFHPEEAGLPDAYADMIRYFVAVKVMPDAIREAHPALTMDGALGTLQRSLLNVETAAAVYALRSNRSVWSLLRN